MFQSFAWTSPGLVWWATASAWRENDSPLRMRRCAPGQRERGCRGGSRAGIRSRARDPFAVAFTRFGPTGAGARQPPGRARQAGRARGQPEDLYALDDGRAGGRRVRRHAEHERGSRKRSLGHASRTQHARVVVDPVAHEQQAAYRRTLPSP